MRVGVTQRQLSRQRELQVHARFAALAVPEDENAAVEPREPLRDRETEPRIRRAGERILPPRHKGLGKLFLRQARPVVADGELAAAAELSQPEDDLPAVAGAADAVAMRMSRSCSSLLCSPITERHLPAGRTDVSSAAAGRSPPSPPDRR